MFKVNLVYLEGSRPKATNGNYKTKEASTPAQARLDSLLAHASPSNTQTWSSMAMSTLQFALEISAIPTCFMGTVQANE